MRRKRMLVFGAALAASCLFAGAASASIFGGNGDRTVEVLRELNPGRARNVIMFLGDGMGDSEITIARNYQVGAAGRLSMDSFLFSGEYTTYAVKKGAADVVDYVTDSAASGTGWSTGHKTYNNAISVDPVTGKPMTTILEMAQKAGFKTGDITTAELTDATPAVLASHISLRGCQGPADMSTCPNEKKPGGLGSIAEQMVDHKVDVLMGGGRARFEQTVTGGQFVSQTVVQQATTQGFNIAFDVAGMQAAQPGKPFLGLFASGNMDLEWSGALAAPYPGPVPTTCSPNAVRDASQPHLADMTKKAIDLLSAQSRPFFGRGFFLQVEGASIDKQDHAENPCGQIGETVAFDAAIQVALDWQKTHPDTLIVITADHGHTSQIVDPQTATDHSPGAIATIISPVDNQPMVINYATNLHGRSQSHTGTEVRIVAKGPQAANVLGTTDQTDLFHTMARAMGLE